MSNAPRARGDLLIVLGASAAFSTSAPLSKFVSSVDPIVVALVRVSVATIVLGALDLRAFVRAVATLERRVALLAAIAGVLLGAHFALFQWGLAETSLPAAVSLVALEPLSVVLAAWLFFAIRPRRLETIGLLVATAGALLLGLQADGASSTHSLHGNLLVLGAVSLFGVYVCAARAVGAALNALHFAPLVYFFATLTLAAWVAIAPGSELPRVDSLSTSSILGLCALALVPTVIGHTLVQYGARRLRPSVLALVSPAETLGSTALASITLGIVPTAIEAVGGLVIILGAGLAAQATTQGPAAPS